MGGLNYTEFESINRIISNLYSSVDLPLYNRVINFFNMLLEEMHFDMATILIFFKNPEGFYEKKSSISLNWDQEKVKKYNEYYCRIDDILPAIDQNLPVLFKTSEYFNQTEREQTAFYQEYLIPNNCVYAIEGNILLPNEPSLRGSVSFARGRGREDFTEQDLQLVRLFQPHLSNILTYYGQETSLPGMASILEDYNSVGVGILNEKFEIVRCNNTFRKFSNPDRSGEQKQEVFLKIVQLCKNLLKENQPANRLSAEYKFADKPIFLEVTNILAKNAADVRFSCLIYDLSHFYTHALQKVEEKYHLTRREMDILKSVLKGCSNEKIARDFFLSLPTVKRYTAAIYEKMEIRSFKQIFEKLKFLD